jgi:hypothetical protein
VNWGNHKSPETYFGDPLLAGGHGVPAPAPVFGLEVPGPEDDPELADEPVSGVPGLVADPLGAPGVPGIDPQGDPLGEGPGVVFGSIVDGLVVLPGVGWFGEFEPGTVEGVEFGEFGVEVVPGWLPGVDWVPDGFDAPGV